jgi:hypothetical protein
MTDGAGDPHPCLHRTTRLTTRSDPPARFQDLDEHPIEVLETIRVAMEGYADQWEDQAIRSNSLGLNKEFLAECEKDLDGFRGEINRFCAAALLPCNATLDC